MALSPEVRRFVIAKIPSVSHLEALLLLRSAGAAWSMHQLGTRLYVPDVVAERLADDLQVQGLTVRLGDNVQYRPKSQRLAQIVDELAASYTRSLVEVSQLIHSVTDKKARRFADAFLMRMDDSEDPE